MDCPLIEDLLVGYHLGALADDDRGCVEAHLVDCGRCLRGFIAVKRICETAGDATERPSAAARARLRAEVARRFPPRRRFRLAWLGGASIAAAIVIFAWQQSTTRPRREPPPAATTVDSALPAPETLNYI